MLEWSYGAHVPWIKLPSAPDSSLVVIPVVAL